MTPEYSLNNGCILDLTGRQSVSPETMAPISADYQCIVCKFSSSCSTDVHLHQISVHTLEQLSLSIIGLQILYHLNTLNTNTKSNDTNLLNPAPSNDQVFQSSSSNFTAEDPIYQVQNEPICLKVQKQDRSKNTQEKNNLKAQRILPKTLRQQGSACTVLKNTVEFDQAKMKNTIYFSPCLQEQSINCNQETNITADYLSKVPTFIQPRNFYNQPVLHEGNVYVNQILPIEVSNFENSQDPISQATVYPGIVPNSFLINSDTIRYQEVPNIIIQNPEKFKTPQTILNVPKSKSRILKSPNESGFKKPRATVKKPKTVQKVSDVTVNSGIKVKTPRVYVKKSQTNVKNPKIDVKVPQTNVNSSKVNFEELDLRQNNFEFKEVTNKPEVFLEKPVDVLEEPKVIKQEVTFPEESQVLKQSEVISNKEIDILNQQEKIFKQEILENPISIKSELNATKSPMNLKNPVVVIQKIENLENFKLNISKSQNKFEMKDENFNQVLYNLESVSKKPQILKQESSFVKFAQSPDFSTSGSSRKRSFSPNLFNQNSQPRNKKFKSGLKSSKKVKNTSLSHNLINKDVNSGWNSFKEEIIPLEVEDNEPTDITNYAMQDSLESVSDISNYDDLTNEIFTYLDCFMPQSMKEFNSNSQEMQTNTVSHQTNQLSGFDYSNDSILQINQPVIPVDAGENLWRSSEDNVTYAELVSVFPK